MFVRSSVGLLDFHTRPGETYTFVSGVARGTHRVVGFPCWASTVCTNHAAILVPSNVTEAFFASKRRERPSSITLFQLATGGGMHGRPQNLGTRMTRVGRNHLAEGPSIIFFMPQGIVSSTLTGVDVINSVHPAHATRVRHKNMTSSPKFDGSIIHPPSDHHHGAHGNQPHYS